MTHTSVHQPHDTARTSGVLLHPTSLPGRFGIGDLGDELLTFLDWAETAGLRVWQVLPLNAPGYGNSPYGCLSSYAGNPLLISPQRLLDEGLLPAGGLDDVAPFPEGHIDFGRVKTLKKELLHRSYEHFGEHASDEQRRALAAFVTDNSWLREWALYAALKGRYDGRPWTAWPRGLADRAQDAIADARLDLADEIRFHEYIQWLFFGQWAAVRKAANARGIRIMGDVPIYVAGDSADVWMNREIFQLDEHGQPTVVAGVPPDYFSETGSDGAIRSTAGICCARPTIAGGCHGFAPPSALPTSFASITSAALRRTGKSLPPSRRQSADDGCRAPAASFSTPYAMHLGTCPSSPRISGSLLRKCRS